jgi:spectinomycin phosphotransferase
MHERPAELSDDELIDVLASQWGLGRVELRYLQVGFGGYHWLATARPRGDDPPDPPAGPDTRGKPRASDAGGSRWFVTVNGAQGQPALTGFEAAMETAAGLAAAGLDFVVAPVRTRTGSTVAWLGPGRVVTLFQYAGGTPGAFGDILTGAERVTLAGMLAALHDATPVIDTGRVPVRGLELAERAVLTQSLQELGRPWSGGPYAEPARAKLTAYADGLVRALARFDALAGQVTEDGRSLVITHGEPHAGNLLRTGSRLSLVDWDTVGLAPPERDLWWVLTGDGQEAARYCELTGREVSQDALALYRLRWTLDDISLFLAEFRDRHERTADTEVSWSGYEAGLIGLAAG